MDNDRKFSPRSRASSFSTKDDENKRGRGRPRLTEEELKQRADKKAVKMEQKKVEEVSKAVGKERPTSFKKPSVRPFLRLPRRSLGAAATAFGVVTGAVGTYYSYKQYQAIQEQQEQKALDGALQEQAEQHQQERAAQNDQHGAQEEELRQKHEAQRNNEYLPSFISEPRRGAERKTEKDRRERERETLHLKQERERNDLQKEFKKKAQEEGQRKSSYESKDSFSSPFE